MKTLKVHGLINHCSTINRFQVNTIILKIYIRAVFLINLNNLELLSPASNISFVTKTIIDLVGVPWIEMTPFINQCSEVNLTAMP